MSFSPFPDVNIGKHAETEVSYTKSVEPSLLPVPHLRPSNFALVLNRATKTPRRVYYLNFNTIRYEVYGFYTPMSIYRCHVLKTNWSVRSSRCQNIAPINAFTSMLALYQSSQ